MKKFEIKSLLRFVMLVAVLFVAGGSGAYALEPTDSFYVNDYAGVLSNSTASEIMSTAPVLAAETGAQIVALTVDSLEGLSPHDFAYSIATKWGIGDKDLDNGLLILLAPGEGEIWVEVGYGLEGALNDAKVGRLIDTYALDYYRDGDFDTGTLELYRALLSQVMVEYGLDALPGYEPLGDGLSAAPAVFLFFVVFLVIFILVPIILVRFFKRFGGWGNWGGGGTFHGGSGYSRGFIGSSSSRSSGGFSGGSSRGGGGFRGGGGSFGGGGGGRRF